jgi:hypothetical protein
MIDSVCQTCELKDPYQPSEWFNHIWRLYELQRGGYPFEKDDLSIEEWTDLGALRNEIQIKL